LNYAAGKTCPYSYTIDWSKVTNIQDVVQIIDGHWALTDDGVRTVRTGYDRLLGFGEMNAWTNLLGTVEITIHALDPTGFAVGPIVGWTGHTAEDNGLVGLPLAVAVFQIQHRLENSSLNTDAGLVQLGLAAAALCGLRGIRSSVSQLELF
jgi:hypothetical protein